MRKGQQKGSGKLKLEGVDWKREEKRKGIGVRVTNRENNMVQE